MAEEKKWYVIHTYSGHENKVKTNLEKRIETTEIKDILAESIDKLPEKERMVVTLYYFEELTLKEISAIMRVSESRISQLHTKAILRMRGRLERHKYILFGS